MAGVSPCQQLAHSRRRQLVDRAGSGDRRQDGGPSSMSEQPDLTELITEALQDSVDRGMALPFTVVAVAANGSLFAVKFDGSTGEPIAHHYVDDTFIPPVNVVVVDAMGDAVRIVVGPDGTKQVH